MAGKQFAYTKSLCFEQLPPEPHPKYPGSVMLERLRRSRDGESLGVIIRLPLVETRARKSWIFIPEQPGIQSACNESSLYEFRDVLDRMLVPCVKRKRVASADNSEIDAEVLRWSGHAEVWDSEKLSEEFSVVTDVLWDCPHADVESKEWGGDFPGHGGRWYRVLTTDPQKLKAEIGQRIAGLIDSRREAAQKKARQRMHRPKEEK